MFLVSILGLAFFHNASMFTSEADSELGGFSVAHVNHLS